MSSGLEKADRYLPARPTDRELDEISGALKAGANEALAAQIGGRSERWLRYIKATYADIAEKVAECKAIADGFVQKASFETATTKPGRDGAADRIFWMKNRSQKWTDRRTVTGTLEVDWFPRVVQRSMSAEIDAAVRAKLIGEGLKLPPKTVDAEVVAE